MAEDKISGYFFTQNLPILSKIARENCRFICNLGKKNKLMNGHFSM